MSNDTEKDKKGWAIGGVMVPAGLFIGMGVGWALDHIMAGLFIGLGAGFLGMVIVRLVFGR